MSVRAIRQFVCLSVVTAMLSLSGCTFQPKPMSMMKMSSVNKQSAVLLMSGKPVIDQMNVLTDEQGTVWVPLKEAVNATGYQLVKANNGRSLQIGQSDVQYEVYPNQRMAHAQNAPIQMPHPLKQMDGNWYLSTSSLAVLLGRSVTWSPNQNQLSIETVDDRSSTLRKTNLPAGKLANRMNSMSLGTTGGTGTPATTATLDSLVSYAKSFAGTPYEFSAKPYTVSHHFDCSSFVQYVYAHAGVSIPRSSRSQAMIGNEVAKANLKTGDLLFFFTPGRFKNNQVVGHVGMYIGNGTFIHTYGSPGVTTNRVDDPKWSYRLLFAKRVM